MSLLHRILLCGLFASALAPSAVAAPIQIIPPELHGAIQPQVAVAPGGRVHVVFGKGEAIYHVASADEGRTFSQPVRVAELPKLALGMRRGPRVAATDKVVVITAISHADGTLHGWTSNDGGVSWRERAHLNDAPNSAREGLHAMAADGQGHVFATWLDLRHGRTELWRTVSADGGATWGANALIYQSPDGPICQCCHPSAVMDAQGRVAVMWRNALGGSRDLFAALSSDDGKAFATPQKLGTGTWKLNACPMDGGAIAFDAAGKIRTAWRREKTVFASDAAGEQWLADSAAQPVVVPGKGGADYLWESGGGLMLKKGDSTASRFAENARFAAAASLSSGGAIVVWESPVAGKTTLFAQAID